MNISNPKNLRRLALAMTLSGLLAAPLNAGTADFSGTWTNADPNTKDIDHIAVAQDASGWTLSVFGKCHPTACAWGSVEAHRFARQVGDNPDVRAVVLTGHYETDFSSIEVILKMQGGSRVHYETLTHFKDNSGRSDYFSEGELGRL